MGLGSTSRSPVDLDSKDYSGCRHLPPLCFAPSCFQKGPTRNIVSLMKFLSEALQRAHLYQTSNTTTRQDFQRKKGLVSRQSWIPHLLQKLMSAREINESRIWRRWLAGWLVNHKTTSQWHRIGSKQRQGSLSGRLLLSGQVNSLVLIWQLC